MLYCIDHIIMSHLIPHTPLARHRLHPAYSHKLLQAWHNDSPLLAQDLCLPIFVIDQDDVKVEISSMPGQYRLGANRLVEHLTPMVALGMRSIILFGVITDSANKDNQASFATSPQSPVAKALRVLRAAFPELYLMVDVCLCAYTNHGHCGLLASNNQSINNQASIERLSSMSVFLAENGADCIAPSDMMDGRVGAIKQALKTANLDHRVALCSYAVKFASCFYGPFRDAADSGAQFGDRTLYQLPPASRSLAMRACDRDVEEGADMVMIKPGMPYLDLVREVKDRVSVPVAVYHVSGEYTMLIAGAEKGAFALEEAVMEVMQSFRRAGASIIFTYFTPLILQILHKKNEAHVMKANAFINSSKQ